MQITDIREEGVLAVATLEMPREELWNNKLPVRVPVQVVEGAEVRHLLAEAARRLHNSDNGWMWSMAYGLQDMVKQLEQEGVQI